MRKNILFATIIAFSVIGLGACGNNAALPEEKTETTIVDTETSDDEENEAESTDPELDEDDQETETEDGDVITTVEGKVYSKIVVTGIREEYDSVGYSIAGFMDGSAFQINGMDANGEMIYGDYSPGKPDKLEMNFDPETGKALSVVYYGNYPDPESASQGVEVLNENTYLFGDDIRSVTASGYSIEVSFDPSSAHIDQALRTYFLEGRHDPEGYTEYCKGIYENANSTYSDFKGDNYAYDVMHGIKVTWYE